MMDSSTPNSLRPLAALGESQSPQTEAQGCTAKCGTTVNEHPIQGHAIPWPKLAYVPKGGQMYAKWLGLTSGLSLAISDRPPMS